ncbi:MAG: bacteriohemerythrin [Candidatus Gastranaerophilales bacterium]|nr:bacteriohemerythrin [Candidatus Gastranaerophilales bacterium]
MLQWNNRLKLGIDMIDEQHKQIFVVTNNLLDAFKRGSGQDQAYDAICFLEEYVKKHFQAEEFYFGKLNYPEKEYHIRLHRAFEAKLGELKDKHRKMGITRAAAKEISDFLVNWWVSHIQNVDRRYADLNARVR